jgi:hypothetical protein
VSLLGALALAVTTAGVAAQEAAPDAPAPALLFHPAGPGVRRLAVGLGVTLDLQRYATDGQIPVVPLIDLRFRYGLPAGFFATAELRTLFLVNDATAGVGWSMSFPRVPRLSFMARFMAGAQIGWLVGSGFRTATVTPVWKPSLALGLAVNDGLRWTLREQLLFTYWQLVDNGGYWTDNKPRRIEALAGTETELTLENLLDRGGNIYFGLAAAIARPSVTLWIPFAQQSELYFYPRLFAGYAF